MDAEEPPQPEHAPRVRDRSAAWSTAVASALGTRVLFMPLAWAVAWLLASSRGVLDLGTFVQIWERWDATILLRIAELGYERADPHATAFFPLFPLVVRGVELVVGSYVIAGLIVNAAASVVAFAYLYRLVDEEIGEGAGRRAVLYLALFPTSVFLIAPYSEALFLAGAITAFYYARAGRWWHVCAPAAVATGARFAGVFVLIGLVVELARRRIAYRDRIVPGVVALIAGVLPLAAYMAYLWRAHGSAVQFVVHQRLGWHRRFVGPVDSFLATWNATSPDYPTNWIFAWKIEIVAALLGVIAVVVAVRARRWAYAAYMAATLSVLMTSTWYYSIPRMLLSLFPIPVMLAARTQRRPQEHEPLLITFTAIAAVGVVVYTRHAWFF